MASPTDAEEALRSTREKENFQRLTRLLMCGGVRLLREKFDSFHSPTILPFTLANPAIQAQLRSARISPAEWNCLYPSSGTFGQSSDFDITLTFRLLRTICNLTEPITGWNNPPNSADHSLEADLVRIKLYRNSVYGHTVTMEITDLEFGNLWREISEALLRIAGSISQAKRDEWNYSIVKLLQDPLTPEAQTYVDELWRWYRNDIEVREAVGQLSDQLQLVNLEFRDQFQQLSQRLGDQLQLVNQRLDSVLIRIGVKEHRQVNLQDPPITEPTIWHVIVSFRASFNLFLDYLKVRLGLSVEDCREGSLLITVTCSSLEILEGLWEDYRSGHLNTIAEKRLVTTQVLEKLGLTEVRLKTRITEDNYRKCRAFFLRTLQRAASEQGRQKAREDHEKKITEMLAEMEIERQQALRQAQKRAKIEDEEERRKLKRQKSEREEKEKMQKEEERFLQLKSELMNYDFQTCPRIKKESFRDLDVDDIDVIRIALIGPTGSGKTSFVGTLQRAIGEPQSAFEQGPDGEGTIYPEEYFIQTNIRMVDTRGFLEGDEKFLDEFLNILTGRIRPGEEIVRDYDMPQEPIAGFAGKPQAPGFSEYVHAVIFVLKADDPRLEQDTYKETLQKIRGFFWENGYSPITVCTYRDMFKTEEDVRQAFDKAYQATGCSSERTYFITNYTHQNSEECFAVERTALDILDSALLSAENFIRIRKQREKNRSKREAMAGGAIGRVETVTEFFTRLKKKYHLTDQGCSKALLNELHKKEINTVKALRELWEEVKTDLPLSIGMRKIMEQEL